MVKRDIFQIIKSGNIEELKKCSVQEINGVGKKGITPLVEACMGVEAGMVEILIDRGADVDSMNHQGRTPIIVAAEKGRLEAVRLLIEAGAFIDADFEKGLTALILAAEKGHLEVVKYLVLQGANVNAAYIYSGVAETALYRAVKNNRNSVVSFLLEQKADPNIATDLLPPQIMINAAEMGNIEIISMLIQHQAYISGDELVKASSLGYADVVEILLEACMEKVSVTDNIYEKENILNKINEAFILAENKATTECFIKYKNVDIDYSHNGEYNALLLAIQRNNREQAAFLLEHGAQSDPFYDDERPVNFTAGRGRQDILDLLISYGASLEPKVKIEETVTNGPLFYAIWAGDISMAEHLLDRGADINGIHSKGMTALMAAAGEGQTEMAAMLVDRGADIDIVDAEGKKALDYAEDDSVKTLLNK